MSRDLVRWCREHPLLTLLILVPACAGAGYGASAPASGTLREALLVGSTTLIFGALFGGMVKFLLEDVQRARERRNEHVRFVSGILADLKSVYDRVERVRVLIVAHRSALTYGKEMRDLIDAAVQLRNVLRALNGATSNLPEPDRTNLVLAVESMEKYLNSLIEEFKERYKPIADKQRIYEAAFENFLKQTKPGATQPDNPAWRELQDLARLRAFRPVMSLESESSTDESSTGEPPTAYKREFIEELGQAASILRGELNRISGGINSKVRGAQKHPGLPDSC